MSKFFIFSIVIHGMFGMALLTFSQPAPKSEASQPIWITLIESESGLPSGEAAQGGVNDREPLQRKSKQTAARNVDPPAISQPPETVLTSFAPFAPWVSQDPLGEPATGEDHERQESPPPTPVEDYSAEEGNDAEQRDDKTAYDFNTEDIEFKEFIEEVRSRLDQAKRYPWLARLRGIEGRIQVRFRILPSGEPAEIEIVQSSRSPLLDQEAIATVRRVSRFPEPPAASSLGVVVRLPFVFHLQGGSAVGK